MKALVRAILPRTIRPRRILAGPLRGLRLVTSWHDYPSGLTGRTERQLLDWFARHVRTGETWLDVGAHYGYTAFALARLVGAAGRVFTFEPVPATAGCIDQARVLNHLSQVTVLPFGLGAADDLELRQLALTRGMADSTLGVGDLLTASVALARFDWLWPLVCGRDPAIHGIKIDVQGMELDVLAGMRQAMHRWQPRLVIELHEGVSRDALSVLLREIGYSTAGVPITPEGAGTTPRFLDNRSYVFHPA